VEFEENYRSAQHIFFGKVRKVEYMQPPHAAFLSGPIKPPCGDKTVVFDIIKSWKGTQNGRISVFAEDACAGLGGTYQTGKTYVVYAYPYDGKLLTTICHRTRLVTKPDEDEEILGLEEMGGR
jgi:hypothetical protein